MRRPRRSTPRAVHRPWITATCARLATSRLTNHELTEIAEDWARRRSRYPCYDPAVADVVITDTTSRPLQR